MSQMKTFKVGEEIEVILCSAVSIAIHQCGLEACTLLQRSGSVVENDKAELNLSALN